MPIRLSPYERQQLEWLQKNEGTDPQGAGMFFDILGGAQERFDTQRAQRQEGMQGLREMALQLAASGASEEALSNALTGQASSLPLMGPRYGGEERLEGLEGFVSGLYDNGPVSGLAPLDMRAPVSGVIDDEDRAAIDSLVNQQMTQGMSFTEIREQVRREFIAQGYDEFSTSEAEQEAQSAYERLIGTSLDEMRDVGADLRSFAGGNELEAGHLENLGLGQEFGALTGGGNVPVESFMAQLVNDPQMFQELQKVVGAYEPDTRNLFQRTIGGLFGPSSGMPFGV